MTDEDSGRNYRWPLLRLLGRGRDGKPARTAERVVSEAAGHDREDAASRRRWGSLGSAEAVRQDAEYRALGPAYQSAALALRQEAASAWLRARPHRWVRKPGFDLMCICGLFDDNPKHSAGAGGLFDTFSWLDTSESAAPLRALFPDQASTEAAEPTEPELVTTGTAEGDDEPAPLPPGVLGYAVGFFPESAGNCAGLTHTGVMSLASAGHELQEATGRRPSLAYRVVEIREVTGD